MVPNFHKCKESVPNPHTCEDLVPNPNTCDMLDRTYHMYEELVLNRQKMSVKNCEELESNAKCSRFFLYFVIVRNTYVCYMKLTSCVNFTKCEILVRNK